MLKFMLKPFKRKPEVLSLNSSFNGQLCIIAANHSAASGPFTFELYLNKFFVPWSVADMCGGYTTRRKYLYHTFYRKKLGYGKIKSFFIATIFALVSKMLYRATEVIPTFTNAKLKNTIVISIQKLKEGKSILIFPENSDSGYKMPVEEYNAGFVFLSKQYFIKTGIDLPIVPIAYSKKANMLVIGENIYLQRLLKQGLTERQVSDKIMEITNGYYFEYIKTAEELKNKK